MPLGLPLPVANALDGPVSKPHFWGLSSLWARALLVGLLYALAGWLSVRLALSADGTAMLWLPNAVVLAALMLSPRRHWWAFVLPVPLWEGLVDWGLFDLQAALTYGLANALEVTLAATLLRLLCGPRFSLERLAHMGWFCVLAAGLASATAAWAGAGLQGYRGDIWAAQALVWWLGDSLGLLVLTPLLIDLWGPREQQQHRRLLRSLRWWPATGVLLGLNLLVFWPAHLGWTGPVLSVVVVMPALAWIALRYGPVGGAWAALWTALLAIAAMRVGSGPHAAMGPEPGGLLLQEFLWVMALAAQGLGSLLAEVRRRERSLRIYLSTVEASQDSILIADARAPDQPLVYVNPSFQATTGYSAQEVLGRNCRFMYGDDRDQPELQRVRDALRQPEPPPLQVVVRNYRKNGEMFWNQLSLAPVHDARGRLTHIVGVQRDVTGLKQAQAALETARTDLETQNHELEDRVLERTRALELLSTTDPLTGTRNRRYLMEQAAREFARAHRYGRSLSCLLFDIDHFKRINDTHGHAVGDTVLIALCLAVQAMLRPGDTLARFGGEEFVVLLPETDSLQACSTAERLRQCVAELVVPLPGPAPAGDAATALRLTVSVGVATASVLVADPDALFRAADAAMYQAKQAGRNRVVAAVA